MAFPPEIVLRIIKHLHKPAPITFKLIDGSRQSSRRVNRTYIRDLHPQYNRGFNGDFEADDLWANFIGYTPMRTNKYMKTIEEFHTAYLSVIYSKYKSKTPLLKS